MIQIASRLNTKTPTFTNGIDVYVSTKRGKLIFAGSLRYFTRTIYICK